MKKIIFILLLLSSSFVLADQKDSRLNSLFDELFLSNDNMQASTILADIWDIWLIAENVEAQEIFDEGNDMMDRGSLEEGPDCADPLAIQRRPVVQPRHVQRAGRRIAADGMFRFGAVRYHWRGSVGRQRRAYGSPREPCRFRHRPQGHHSRNRPLQPSGIHRPVASCGRAWLCRRDDAAAFLFQRHGR